jgi:hypothetical protein
LVAALRVAGGAVSVLDGVVPMVLRERLFGEDGQAQVGVVPVDLPHVELVR